MFILKLKRNIIIKPFSELHDNVLIVGQISVIICCCIYLFEKFNGIDDDSLLNDYFFWMISGLLLFNLGDFTYFRLLPIIKENKWDRLDKWFQTINNSLLLLLFLSYILSIIIYM